MSPCRWLVTPSTSRYARKVPRPHALERVLWLIAAIVLLSGLACAQDTAPPVYPSGSAYESIQTLAQAGPGKSSVVLGYDSIVVKVSWSSTWDRTLSFTANTPANLTYQALTCTHLESGAQTNTATAQGAYLCSIRGKQSFRTPITGGTSGSASVTLVSKLPITMPVIARETVVEGPIGPTGPQGEPGVGIQGFTGPTGPAGASYNATSATLHTIGTGAKTFSTQSGKAYLTGSRVRASATGDPTNYLEGQVTSYSGTTLQVSADHTSGSGSYGNWNLSLAGDVGDFPATGNLTETTSSVLTITGGTGAVAGAGTAIAVKQATTSQAGYLSSTDWNTFNGKQAALGFTPENVANKATSTSLGTSNTLYPSQNAVKDYVDTGLATKLATVTADSPLTGSGTPGSHLGCQLATAIQDGCLSSSDWDSFNNRQPALGFTAENVANKTTSTSLGTSDTLYPSQKAVKTYVDTATAALGTVDAGTAHRLAYYPASTNEVGALSAAPTSGRYLKGTGTDWDTSSGSASGVGSCTNQAVTALNSDAAPTCTSPTEAYLSLSDVATGDVSTARHGFAPKAPNDATKYLDGTGAYTSPFAAAGTAATIWFDESQSLVGTWAGIANASQPYNIFWRNAATHADGDSLQHDFILAAGSYTLSVLGATTTNEPKIDWYIDNVLAVSGQDWYDSTTNYGIVKTASVTVTGSGKHTLKGVINGKNGSSSDYLITLTKAWLR